MVELNRDGVLACDLDETLLLVNSFPLFVRSCVSHAWSHRRYVVVMRIGVAVAVRRIFRGSHTAFKRRVHVAAAHLGDDWAEAWGSRLYVDWKNDYVADFVKSWKGHSVLVTAAPAIYVRGVARVAGFDTAIGSDFRAGSYVNNVGIEKVVRLRELSLLPLEVAMSDDAVLDGPMMAEASVRVYVKPGVPLTFG